jgi:sugar phosphate isomerase/epimerase
MPTLVLCDDRQTKQIVPLATAYHCGIEIQSFWNPEFLKREPNAISYHQQVLNGIDTRGLHGPFADLCPGSIDEMVREVARNRFNLAVQIAQKLNSTHIILHHGYVPGTSHPSGWLSRSTVFWRAFLDAVPKSIQIHLENLLEFDPELISEVVSSINRPNLDICLDIGHAHCNSKRTVIYWIEQLKQQIGWVHMHDNHGGNDEHLGLGRGNIPMHEVCQALLEYTPKAVWALESEVSQTEQSIKWLKENKLIFT